MHEDLDTPRADGDDEPCTCPCSDVKQPSAPDDVSSRRAFAHVDLWLDING